MSPAAGGLPHHTQGLQHEHQSTTWLHPEGQISRNHQGKNAPLQRQDVPVLVTRAGPGNAHHPALCCGHKDAMEGGAWPAWCRPLRAPTEPGTSHQECRGLREGMSSWSGGNMGVGGTWAPGGCSVPGPGQDGGAGACLAPSRKRVQGSHVVPERHPSWLSNLAPSHRWSRWRCWRLPPHKATGQEDVPETPPLDLRPPPTLELSGRHPCPAPPHCSLTLCPTTQVSFARPWPHGFSQPPGAVCSAKATLVSITTLRITQETRQPPPPNLRDPTPVRSSLDPPDQGLSAAGDETFL